MNYNPMEVTLYEMITSKNISISILNSNNEFIVIDSKGIYEAKGFETVAEAKHYIFLAYNLKSLRVN